MKNILLSFLFILTAYAAFAQQPAQLSDGITTAAMKAERINADKINALAVGEGIHARPG